MKDGCTHTSALRPCVGCCAWHHLNQDGGGGGPWAEVPHTTIRPRWWRRRAVCRDATPGPAIWDIRILLTLQGSIHPPGALRGTSSTESSLEFALRRSHFLCIAWGRKLILMGKWRHGNEWRPTPWYGDTSKSSPWSCPSVPSLAPGKIIKMQKYHFLLGVCPFKKQLVNSKPHYTTHIPIRSSRPRNGRMGPPPAIVNKNLATYSF